MGAADLRGRRLRDADRDRPPFKIAFLGPAQQSMIVDDQHYGDGVDAGQATSPVALNKELHYLRDMGCEAVQLIDVLPPYTQDMWQIEVPEHACSRAST